jgi:nicotinamidase-related amidase
MKTAIGIDIQEGFTRGSLKNDAAIALLPKIKKFIKDFQGPLIFSQDEHNSKLFPYTLEGQKLGVLHCCSDEEAPDQAQKDFDLVPEVLEAAEGKCYDIIEKPTFGTFEWAKFDRIVVQAEELYVFGFVSDICVISNLLILRVMFPDKKIVWLAYLSAGTTPENHQAAIAVARSCEIEVIEKEAA